MKAQRVGSELELDGSIVLSVRPKDGIAVDPGSVLDELATRLNAFVPLVGAALVTLRFLQARAAFPEPFPPDDAILEHVRKALCAAGVDTTPRRELEPSSGHTYRFSNGASSFESGDFDAVRSAALHELRQPGAPAALVIDQIDSDGRTEHVALVAHEYGRSVADTTDRHSRGEQTAATR